MRRYLIRIETISGVFTVGFQRTEEHVEPEVHEGKTYISMKRLSKDRTAVAEVLEILVLGEEFLIWRTGYEFPVHCCEHIIAMGFVACDDADVSVTVIWELIDGHNACFALVTRKQFVEIHGDASLKNYHVPRISQTFEALLNSSQTIHIHNEELTYML